MTVILDPPARTDLKAWLSAHLDPVDDHGPVKSGDGHEAHGVPAAVLIGLIERPEGYNVLLTRRADTLRHHGGQIALPGGRCDMGETAVETAVREAWEEVGLDPAFVSIAGLSSPHMAHTGFLIMPVVGFVSPGFELRPNPGEVAEIFETPFGFLMNPGNYQEEEKDFGEGLRRFISATHDERYIWGATAAILMELYRRLYGACVA